MILLKNTLIDSINGFMEANTILLSHNRRSLHLMSGAAVTFRHFFRTSEWHGIGWQQSRLYISAEKSLSYTSFYMVLIISKVIIACNAINLKIFLNYKINPYDIMRYRNSEWLLKSRVFCSIAQSVSKYDD